MVKSFQKFNRFDVARIGCDSVKLSSLKLPKSVENGLMRRAAWEHRRVAGSEALKVKVRIERELGGPK